MRSIRTVVSVAIVAAALLSIPVGVSGAAPTECDGTYTGTTGHLTVGEGSVCILDGATVEGNIKVTDGGILRATDSNILGNVLSNGAAEVTLLDTAVGRNIHVQRTSGQVTIGAAGCRIDPTVGNNLHVFNNFGGVAICEMAVGNNIKVTGNSGRIGIFHNTAGNNLDIFDNSGKAIRVRDNVADNNVKIFRNTTSKVLAVKDNEAGVNFICRANQLDPTTSGNTAGGALMGQCAN